MPELERMTATRIVATQSALDALQSAMLMRIATDEAMVIGSFSDALPSDPHAIVEREDGFTGVWLSAELALAFLEKSCEWELPQERPAFAQGAVAGIPTKLWFEPDRVLFLVPAPYAHDFEERIS